MNYKVYFFLMIWTWGLWALADEVIKVPVNQHDERHIVIVVASYNNINYYRQNLDSIFNQQYSNYHVIYIDDCSVDHTYEAVDEYIRQCGKEQNVLLLHNDVRRGALYNQYHAIHRCKDTDIIVILDGDDFFHDKDVLSFLNSVYKNPRIWLTYGQFMLYPSHQPGWCVAMPDHIVQSNKFREYGFIPGHLRTFYAGLFKQIKREDLIYEGDFFRMAGDIAVMFPMIEMAREGHFQFISKILMDYNDANPINNYKVAKDVERKLDLEIRDRGKYWPVTTPFLSQNGGIESLIGTKL